MYKEFTTSDVDLWRIQYVFMSKTVAGSENHPNARGQKKLRDPNVTARLFSLVSVSAKKILLASGCFVDLASGQTTFLLKIDSSTI